MSASLLAPFTSPYQTFRQVPVPNTRSAIYTLSIRYPGALSAPYSVYTFPMSPSSLRKTYTAMSTAFDTAGDPSYQGVQRQVDIYGNAPVTYVLEGTTGFNRHSNDAYLATGLQSIQNLATLLAQYAELNQYQIQAGISVLYTLEFYDYFSNDFWQVEPLGQQGFYQDASQPLWIKYRFMLAGVKRVDAPIFSSLADPIGQLFNAAAGPVMTQVQSTITSTLSAYGIG